ncbi:hypothetical protein L1277_002569 [Okibacterium sp. HSC-33S16]|uniref:hypothetical protein n=1 Tax=Okibacterium sp. HSC-33S16 TaxID=2910965 RepID=UPI00209F7289|nr:hypothetical protein [Okibacterium sp. HSC-33S16]MCP2032466.1 hypothetical protein [Okibacterium sp. HSC-33S16]
MSNTPPNDAPSRAPRPGNAQKRMLAGLVCFGLGLLLAAGGVVVVILSALDSAVLGAVLGVLAALVGIAVNFTGLVLLYRALTGSISKDPGSSEPTP